MSLDASWSTLWRPLVEIFILAVGIYYVLMFVRRTHGWGVLIGFLVLLGMLAVTALLDLSVLKWMLLQFFGFSAYAILILFHPEIRRLLAQLAPREEAIRWRPVANRQPCVRDCHTREPVRHGSDQPQTDQAAPILANKCDVIQIKGLQPLLHPTDMASIGKVV